MTSRPTKRDADQAVHERIWAIQKPFDFLRVVFGLDRPGPSETIMPELTRRYAVRRCRLPGR